MLLFCLSIITGGFYPGIITLFAQIFFPWAANGSIIEYQGKNIGSKWIGQFFSDPRYFWGRPSATTPYPYNGASSSGSNLGPSNPKLVSALINQIRLAEPENSNQKAVIPIDFVTHSASGLDPDISPETAFYQVKRIARHRNMSEKVLESLIQNHIQTRFLGILGEPRVNVLELNLALDQIGS